MALVGAVGVLLVAVLLRRLGRSDDERRVALTAVALLPLLLGGVILTRFDLVPATLVAAALLLFLAERHTAGAIVLGLGIAAKLYPAVLVPLVAVAAYRRGGSRAAVTTVALAALPVVVLYLPFLVVGLDGVLDSFGRQLGRPLQIESLGAGVLLALHHVAGVARVVVERGLAEPGRGRRRDAGRAPRDRPGRRGRARLGRPRPWAGGRRAARPPRCRGRRRVRRVQQGALAAVPGLAAPPRAARRRRGRTHGALAAGGRVRAHGAVVPALYWELVREFDPFASFLVLARGATLVALYAVLMWPARERARARSRSPVPSPGRT